MKRIFSLLLSVALVMGCFVGCEKDKAPKTASGTQLSAEDQKVCEEAFSQLKTAVELPKSAEKDLVVEQVQHYEGESVVHYAQTWQDVEIYGSSVVVSTGEEGLCLGDYYDLTDAFGKDFKDQVKEAEKVPEWMTDLTADGVALHYDTATLKPVIFVLPDDTAVVARQVEAGYTSGTMTTECTLVFSLDGTMLYDCSSDRAAYTNVTVNGPSNGSTAAVSEDGKFYAYNQDMGFYVYAGDEDDAEDYVTDTGAKVDLSHIYFKNNDDWTSGAAKRAFQAMTAFADVSDWYDRVLGYKGIDGKGGTAMLILSNEVSGSVAANAHRYGYMTYLFVMKHGYTAADAPEILAHEYGHAVIKNISGIRGSGQTGAVCEAICDCFGAVYGDNWHLAKKLAVDGTDKNIPGTKLRHMDDYIYDTLDDYGDKMDQYFDNPYYSYGYKIYEYTSILGLVDDYITMSSDAYHSHDNAYIISYILYRIWDKVFERNNEVFASILYNSIRYLPKDVNFSEFRTAFLHAARKVFDTEKVAYASTFFDVAGIYTSQKSQLVNIGTAKDVSVFSYSNLLSMPYEEIRAMDWDEFNFFDAFDYPGMWYAHGVKGRCSVYLDFTGEKETLNAKPNSVSVYDSAEGGSKLQVLPKATTGMTYDQVKAAYPQVTDLEYDRDMDNYTAELSLGGGIGVFMYFQEFEGSPRLANLTIYHEN